MKASEIRAMSADEIDAKILDLKEEHFNLRFQHSVGQLENTTLLPKVKRVFALLDMADFFRFFKDPEEAARSFSAAP